MTDTLERSVMQGDALIIVDVQNDFLPAGSLAVPEGDAVISILNQYLAIFRKQSLPIFATRDWHPENHCSFTEQGGTWPPHCIANTPGANFPSELDLSPDVSVISKATSADKDAYSGFEDTSLDQQLHNLGVKRVFVGGLATDYCVLNTVKDAITCGYEVILLKDAVRAVNVQADDGLRALDEMKDLGAIPVQVSQFDS